MRKSILTGTFSLLMAATAPVAFAQTTAPGAAPMHPADTSTSAPMHPDDTSTSASFTTQSGQLRASEVIGSTVYDVQNRDIGKVKDVLVDQNGKVSAVVIDVGSFLGVGGKYVSVALNDMKTTNDRLTLDRSKEQLQSMPAYHLDNRG